MSAPAYLAVRYGDRSRLFAYLVRLVCGGDQSHTELAYMVDGGQFRCWSSSWTDGGVRAKTMPLPASKWRLYRLPEDIATADSVETFGQRHDPVRYDWLGLGRFVFPWWPRMRRRRFCSHFCSEGMRLQDGHLVSPRMLEIFGARVGVLETDR